MSGEMSDTSDMEANANNLPSSSTIGHIVKVDVAARIGAHPAVAFCKIVPGYRRTLIEIQLMDGWDFCGDGRGPVVEYDSKREVWQMQGLGVALKFLDWCERD